MKARKVKNRIYEQFARIGKALSSPQRLEIVEILAQGERTVEALADALSIPVANASHHLRALRAARLVDSRKEGTFVYYRLAAPEVFELTRSLRTLAERQLEEVDRIVRSYFHARDELEPVTREALRERARAGDAIVLDVRPAEEYRAGHIPGAFSVPVAEIERRLDELPAGKEIIAYCRGPFCVMAVEAVQKLRMHGRAARRLVEGFPEWRAAGLPVESENSP
ncbi:MAG TPA: metalloregulator ArsR/SmtB family transcription factor [Candidatus Binatia bacterium]|nr:metalloregulator ArsR/SmtB family transcription factor [Candidatus Binatia bacterium]